MFSLEVCQKYELNPEKFHSDPQAWLEYDLTLVGEGHRKKLQEKKTGQPRGFPGNLGKLRVFRNFAWSFFL